MVSGTDILNNLLEITISSQRLSYGTHLNFLPYMNESKTFVCVGKEKNLFPLPSRFFGWEAYKLDRQINKRKT